MRLVRPYVNGITLKVVVVVLMRVGWVQPCTIRDVLVSLRRRFIEELGLRSLKVDSIGYLMEHLEGEELWDF